MFPGTNGFDSHGMGRGECSQGLMDLIHMVWEEGSVPRDWSDAVLIPISEKGDLSCCDNWCGIALLEVV